MLSTCSCFCLFSLDSRSWWTCSSFTFCRTRPDSPTVQSSSAQLISLCLGLQGSKAQAFYIACIIRNSACGIHETMCQLTCPLSAWQIQNQTVPGVMGVKCWSEEPSNTHSLKQRESTGLINRVQADLCQFVLWQRFQWSCFNNLCL